MLYEAYGAEFRVSLARKSYDVFLIYLNDYGKLARYEDVDLDDESYGDDVVLILDSSGTSGSGESGSFCTWEP